MWIDKLSKNPATGRKMSSQSSTSFPVDKMLQNKLEFTSSLAKVTGNKLCKGWRGLSERCHQSKAQEW